MKKLFKHILLLLLCSCLTHCEIPIKQLPFDKELWNKQMDNGYEYREPMLVDLVNSYLKQDITQTEVIELLGEPSNKSANIKPGEHGYFLNEDYDWDIDPTTMKYLILTFKEDSTLNEIYKRTWEVGKGTKDEKLVLKSSPI